MYKLLLCWRYLRTRYIALVCIVSVMLGVATMIVVNSVMAGFSHEMQSRINGMLGDVDNLERERVRVGDLDGYRVTYTKGEGDDMRRFDELYLIDARKSGVYLASLQCDEKCHDVYGDEIEDVLTTFRVEP